MTKIFLSYSHKDEEHVRNFLTHTAPLKNEGNVEFWYDRKLIPGNELLPPIDKQLEDSDVVCLFVSSYFLASPACMKEKQRAFELYHSKAIFVIPIIISKCAWLDDKEIQDFLALPTDGKTVTSHEDVHEAWFDVYEGLKISVDQSQKLSRLTIKESFSEFLEDSGLLRNAHSQKEEVALSDIFVHPEFELYDSEGELEEEVKGETLTEGLFKHQKVLIAGDSQAGKSCLLKMTYKDLYKRGYVPILVEDKEHSFQGKISNHLRKSFEKQYEGCVFDDLPHQRIIPIIDDFHYARDKESILDGLESYDTQIVATDDIFNLNIRNDLLVDQYSRFTIKELKPSLRHKLIKKWLTVGESSDGLMIQDNDMYQKVDSNLEFVEASLGKVLGKGIIPSYPFFILSILSSKDAYQKPLDQEITSQGYCYQALIYMYLKKHGVKSDEIDSYLNFLTEFAYSMFTRKEVVLQEADFVTFLEGYKSRFNMTVEAEKLITTLTSIQIISRSSVNDYKFKHDYLYYFFAARHISENISSCKDDVSRIMSNLHKNENAYIAIFITHHCKKDDVIDEIILNAYCLFDKYKPAVLDTKELSFFDKEVNQIAQEVLPNGSETPEKHRHRHLEQHDQEEKSQSKSEDEDIQQDEELGDEYAAISKDLRRSIKTVEVMGRIIKNRSGSMLKARLEEIFEEAMNVHLRILTSFINIIETPKGQAEILDFLTQRIDQIIQESPKKQKPTRDEIKRMAKALFWNVNFMVIYSTVKKIVHSIGSENLIGIAEEVCNRRNTPASHLVKHGILMWYKKNVRVEEIATEINKSDFPETAKRVMKYQIVNHCSMHSINYKDKQRIADKIGIPTKRLLLEQVKSK